MMYHAYIEYRCTNVNRVAAKIGITRNRLQHHSCPRNLTPDEVVALKACVGDWETFEPQNLKIENGKLVKEGE